MNNKSVTINICQLFNNNDCETHRIVSAIQWSLPAFPNLTLLLLAVAGKN